MRRLIIIIIGIIIVTAGCKKNDLNGSSSNAIVELSIPTDSIKLNPNGYSPLSAMVNFPSSVDGKTVIIVKGKHGGKTDLKHVFNDMGLNHSIPVIGLYANYLNTVNIRLINNNGDTLAKTTITIQTGSLPSKLPTSIEADQLASGAEEEGINLVSNYSSDHPQFPLMVDGYGDIRWLLDYTNHPIMHLLNYDCGMKRLRNGNFYFIEIETNRIYEIDLFGNVLNSWELHSKGYFTHHDIDEKPDGNFIASVSKIGSTRKDGTASIEDYIVEIDRGSGNIKTVWDLKELLNESRFLLTSNKYDWIHVNSVLYDSTDNTIIVSGRTQGVIKLTFDNKIKWIIAPHKGWGTNGRNENLNQFLLTPLAADGSRIYDTSVVNGNINHPEFEWCWYQHSIIAIPNGDIMLFDNGTYRNFNASGSQYSRAVEYKIDPVNMTIQQKWQYGKERGLETFSAIVSSVQFLPTTNHVLFCPGYNVTNSKGNGGKVIEVDYATKQPVSQLSFSAANNWGFHRTKRISAYPQ